MLGNVNGPHMWFRSTSWACNLLLGGSCLRCLTAKTAPGETLKYAMMFPKSFFSSLWVESCFLSVLVIGMMVLGWIKRLTIFGVVCSKLLFSMSAYLTLMLLWTDQTPTASMKVQSTEHTKSEFMRSSMWVSALLCSPPLKAWVQACGFSLVPQVEDSGL